MKLLISSQHFSDTKCFNLKQCVEAMGFTRNILIITREQLFIDFFVLGVGFFLFFFNVDLTLEQFQLC